MKIHEILRDAEPGLRFRRVRFRMDMCLYVRPTGEIRRLESIGLDAQADQPYVPTVDDMTADDWMDV